MIGKLHLNEIGRWEILDLEYKRYELTSGDLVEVAVGSHWIRTRIESRSAPNPPFTSEYYATVPGIRLYEGMPARTPQD